MTKQYIVWPQYLECSLPRRLGRRVPRDLCIDKVSLDELLKACQALSLKCTIEEGKRYPRAWYLSSGRLIVEFDGSKSELLKLLCRTIKTLRTNRKS